MRNLRLILADEGLLKTARTFRKKVKTSKGDMVFELTAQQAAAFKAMPKGKSFEYDVSYSGDELKGGSWSKRGGHPDAIRGRFWKAVKAAGFREFKSDSHAVPDGSYVGSGSFLKDSEGNVIKWHDSYGPVAADNRYSASLTLKKPAQVSAASLSAAEQREKAAEWLTEILKSLAPFKRSYAGMSYGEFTFYLPEKMYPRWATKSRGFGTFKVNPTTGAITLTVGKERDWEADLEVSFYDKLELFDTRSFLAVLDRLTKQAKSSKKPRQ